MTTRTVLIAALVMTSLSPCHVTSLPIEFTLDVQEFEPTNARAYSRESPFGGFTQEDMEPSAKEFLGKFGYVKPAEWNTVSPRIFEENGFNWTTVEGEADTRGRADPLEGSGWEEEEEKFPVVKWSFDSISETDYQNALIKYQRSNGLNATGELDYDTASYMGRPRCGVPDRTAAVKENRTDELLRLVSRGGSATPTDGQTDPLIAGENATEGEVVIHTITTPSPGLVEEEWEESGDRELRRKKRSGDLQLEAEFEELNSHPGSEELDVDVVRAWQLDFNDLGGGPITEAELPAESRVSDLEGILEILRQEKLSQMNATKRSGILNEVISSIRPKSPAPLPRLVRRMVTEARLSRRKRSEVYMEKTNGWFMAFPKRVITWRLVEEWPSKTTFMISNEIWFTVKLAFRMWSEVIPREFMEDTTSPITNVDILLGFGKRVHNRCLVPFYDTRFVTEYAHAWPLPQAEIHFNDDQPFVSVSWDSSQNTKLAAISLQKVATHEIGHALGLPHSKNKHSIMNPVYKAFQSNIVRELEMADKKAIQEVYGACDVSFDAVFDWIRPHGETEGSIQWKFNTFFFRKSWFWLYENREGRPRYGDPKYVGEFWQAPLRANGNPGPHANIDGIVHIRDWSVPNGPMYLFSGDSYFEFDSTKEGIKQKDDEGNRYPRKIKDGFAGIPYPIDAVYYDTTDRLLHFFKNHLVFTYDWRAGKVSSIQYIFVAYPGWGGAEPLQSNIDAAYYSYTDSAYYFFKGQHFWKRADHRERHYNKGLNIPDNSVGPKRPISSKWHYLCDVHLTEMDMTVRAKT